MKKQVTSAFIAGMLFAATLMLGRERIKRKSAEELPYEEFNDYR